MVKVLLTSEAFIKDVTSISDNIAGKYLQGSIREAQDIGLKGILGSCLLRMLEELVRERKIDAEGYEQYKDLLDRCQYYLAYKSIVELIRKVSYKVTNFGLAKSSDENLQLASFEEIVKQEYYYQSKADAMCYDIQGFLLDNRSAFPELGDCDCHRIKSNLRSAASCGIFFGGARGKGIGGDCR